MLSYTVIVIHDHAAVSIKIIHNATELVALPDGSFLAPGAGGKKRPVTLFIYLREILLLLPDTRQHRLCSQFVPTGWQPEETYAIA